MVSPNIWDHPGDHLQEEKREYSQGGILGMGWMEKAGGDRDDLNWGNRIKWIKSRIGVDQVVTP